MLMKSHSIFVFSVPAEAGISAAVQNPLWIKAMEEEIQALESNNTWAVVSLPQGKSPIGCKWVYKIKYKASGEVERYKTRLIAKGYNQSEGVC
ncbi:hypothetical protein V6N13_109015 [Hibiscus sabdariffa]